MQTLPVRFLSSFLQRDLSKASIRAILSVLSYEYLTGGRKSSGECKPYRRGSNNHSQPYSGCLYGTAMHIEQVIYTLLRCDSPTEIHQEDWMVRLEVRNGHAEFNRRGTG